MLAVLAAWLLAPRYVCRRPVDTTATLKQPLRRASDEHRFNDYNSPSLSLSLVSIPILRSIYEEPYSLAILLVVFMVLMIDALS
jgi:hypothetical protein